jgi:quercetin dioxygenase-like cupin family protein
MAYLRYIQMEWVLPYGIVSAALRSWLDGGAAGAADVAAGTTGEASEQKGHPMQALTGGITKAGTGIDGIVWNILGQTYVPKHVSESSFSWHATFPPGTFVPPHIHPTQEEFIYMFEGRLDLVLDGKEFFATAGDLIRLPMGIAHGLFNKADQPVKCLFWVSPTRKLYDLFWAIHSMKEQNPPDVVALSAKHEVVFLPPPAE